jgi:hypothetical protein
MTLVNRIYEIITQDMYVNDYGEWVLPKDKEIADIAEAIAALSHPTDGWRTIDSAPKDGTPVLGAYFNQPWADSHREGRIVRCWYQPEFEGFISSCREMTLAPGYTFEDGSTRQLHSPDKEDVTHWQPLPTSPLSQKDAD